MVDEKRLLLVEDDATTREVLQLLLRGEGWQVEAVESGEAALAAVQLSGESFSVLLCDLHLAGICGEPLAAALQRSLPNALRIAMTATAGGASTPGYQALLVKPFAPQAVEQAWRSGAAAAGAEDVAEEPALAMTVFEQLRKSMGEEGIRSLYAFALTDAEARLHSMDEAARMQDRVTFVREAHALKGSCGMIGARNLWQLAADAESAGLDDTAAEKVSRLRGSITELRLMLGTLIAV